MEADPDDDEPVWMNNLVDRITIAMEHYANQTSAKLQNTIVVKDSFEITPVPLARNHNDVEAGEIPPGICIHHLNVVKSSYNCAGFPQTRGAFKAMTVPELKALARYYKVRTTNLSKEAILKKLAFTFGLTGDILLSASLPSLSTISF